MTDGLDRLPLFRRGHKPATADVRIGADENRSAACGARPRPPAARNRLRLTISVLSIVLMLFGFAVAAEVSERRDFAFALGAGDRFSIENVNGTISIEPGRGSVEVRADITAESQQVIDRIEIRVDQGNGELAISTEWPRGINRDIEVSYEVTLPPGVVLARASTVNGNVRVEGIERVERASSVNGGVVARGVRDSIELESQNGSVRAAFARLGGDAQARVSTTNGSVSVVLPRDADARIEASTTNGGIDIEGLEVVERDNRGWMPGKSAEAVIGAGAAELRARSTNGSIDIEVR